MKQNYTSSLFLFILFLTMLSFSSCDTCSEMACTTGPPSLVLQLLDKDSDESIFLSGRFNAEDIQVTDERNKQVHVIYDIIEDRDFLLLSFDANEGVKTINVNVSPTFSIPLEVEIEKRSSDCCTNSFIKNVKSPNFPLESAENGTLKIRL